MGTREWRLPELLKKVIIQLFFITCVISGGDVRLLGWVLWNNLFTLRVYVCDLSEASARAFLRWTRFCVFSSMCSIGELGKIWLPSIL